MNKSIRVFTMLIVMLMVFLPHDASAQEGVRARVKAFTYCNGRSTPVSNVTITITGSDNTAISAVTGRSGWTPPFGNIVSNGTYLVSASHANWSIGAIHITFSGGRANYLVPQTCP